MNKPTLSRDHTHEQREAFGAYMHALSELEFGRGTMRPVGELALAYAETYCRCRDLGLCDDEVSMPPGPDTPVTVGQLLGTIGSTLQQTDVKVCPTDCGFEIRYRTHVFLGADRGIKAIGCEVGIAPSELNLPAERVLRKVVGAFEVLLRGAINVVGNKPLDNPGGKK